MSVALLLATVSLPTGGTGAAATAAASTTATIRVQRAVRLNDAVQRERENGRIRLARVLSDGKVQSFAVVEFE